jgi:uncharacterized protein YndB with AHSA1/START domain
MTTITSSTKIARSVEEVFDFAVDLRNELEWNPKVERMEKVTDGPIRVGTTMRGKWTMSRELTLECTRFERPVRWTWINGGPVSVTLTIELTEVDGGTRLDSSFDAHPHGLFRVLFPVFIRIMRKQEAQNMEHLKAYLEREADRLSG